MAGITILSSLSRKEEVCRWQGLQYFHLYRVKTKYADGRDYNTFISIVSGDSSWNKLWSQTHTALQRCTQVNIVKRKYADGRDYNTFISIVSGDSSRNKLWSQTHIALQRNMQVNIVKRKYANGRDYNTFISIA